MQFVDLKTQYQSIEEKIQKRINDVLNHGQFIMGPEVMELEEQLSDFSGSKHSITCANGTDALTIALRALGIKDGDEIISTPFTFFATGETIALEGAKLVFADIDPDTYNIDENKIESLITEKTKAIIPVSLYGQMSNMSKIMEIANRHNLAVIEDGAQSFGAEQDGKKSCSIATVSTTSFFPAKPLGCYGDGGGLFTNNDELAKKIRELRNHGQSKRYTHTSLGYNSRMDTLQAAILLEKLAIFPEEIRLRNEVAKRYNKLIADRVKTPFVRENNISTFAQYTIEVDQREQFKEKMNQHGIPTATHYPLPIHHQPVFKDMEIYNNVDMPLTEKASQRVVSLPMHPYLNSEDQELVVEKILQSL